MLSVDTCDPHWIHWIIFPPKTAWPNRPEKLAKFLPSSTSSLAWQIFEMSQMWCRQIIKSPSQATHTRLPGTSPRECFATVGTMSLNRTMGFWGAKRYTNLIHLADEVVFPCLAMDFLKACERGSVFFPLLKKPEKVLLLPKQLCISNSDLPMWPQDTYNRSNLVLFWRPLELKMLAALPTAVVHGANACTQGHLHQRCCISLRTGRWRRQQRLFQTRSRSVKKCCLPICLQTYQRERTWSPIAPLWNQPFHVPPCLQLYRPANKNSTSGIQTQTRCRISDLQRYSEKLRALEQYSMQIGMITSH